MISFKSEPPAAPRLTARQREAYRLRHQGGATVEQIAAWLKISPRAVWYRLQCAHRRLGEAAESYDEPGDRRRTYSASQLSTAAQGNAVNIDDL